jgi:uncharacterized protein
LIMRNIDSIEEAAQSICTSCGLCCDGTIFKRAFLKPEDSDRSLHEADIVKIQRVERSYFHLPCHHLHNRNCKIYHLWRPQVCGDFKCKILERLFAGELLYKEGIEIVTNTLRHLSELKRLLHVSNTERASLQDMFGAWKNKQKTPDQSVNLSYVAFQFRLDRYFRINKNNSNGSSVKNS